MRGNFYDEEEYRQGILSLIRIAILLKLCKNRLFSFGIEGEFYKVKL